MLDLEHTKKHLESMYGDDEIIEFCKWYLESHFIGKNYFDITDEELWLNVDTEFKYACVDPYEKDKPTIWLFEEEPTYDYHDGRSNPEYWFKSNVVGMEHLKITEFVIDVSDYRKSLRKRP
jgi:hypothetical protein